MGHGLINASPDSDGVIRSVPLVMRVAGQAMPGLALEMARNKLGVDEIRSEPSAITLAGRRIPVDDQARMPLHFGTFPAARIFAAEEVLKAGFPDRAFAGRTVLIGLAAEGTSDIVATPVASEAFGVLVQAQAIDTFLRGGWLERPGWAAGAEWGGALALALLALAAALANRLVRVGAAIAFAAVAVAAWMAFDHLNLLIDPFRPLLVGSGAVAGLVFGSFVDSRRERERLRDILVQERVVAAQAEGELLAARAIQLSMVPPRSSLAAIDRRIDCDALLEPAKSVGGDFYDLVRIDSDRIGFVMADVTGKGVPASLFMAMSKALTQSILSRDLIRGNEEAMCVTMLLGVLDLTNGSIRLVSAGHEHPIQVTPDKIATMVPLEGGLPFGITELPYPVETMTLGAGDKLILLTDGITEAQNGSDDLYGHQRTLSGDAVTMTSATQICEAIRDDVRLFEEGEEATDDLTVMVIRYLGPDASTSAD